MNNDYVITLDKMPGWDNYTENLQTHYTVQAKPKLVLKGKSLSLTLATSGNFSVELFDLSGNRIARLHKGPLSAGIHEFPIGTLPTGVYVTKMQGKSTYWATTISIP